jgi:hypothetical protein
MTTLRIFSVQFGSLELGCTRDMAQGLYILSSRDCRCAISPDEASRLAGACVFLQARAQAAVIMKRGMKPGAVFKRAWPSLTVEIGINSSGDAVYLQVGDLRADLDHGQTAILTAVLGQLDADISTLYRAAAGPAAPDFGVARGLRGFAIRIPGGDDEWV